MTERNDGGNDNTGPNQPDHDLNAKELQRREIIGMFETNVKSFLEDDNAQSKLLMTIGFDSDFAEPVVGNFMGNDVKVYLPYEGLDQEFVKIFEPEQSSKLPPVIVKSIRTIKPFENMPRELTGYIGKKTVILMTIYPLSSVKNQRPWIYQRRYFDPEDIYFEYPLAETWTADISLKKPIERSKPADDETTVSVSFPGRPVTFRRIDDPNRK